MRGWPGTLLVALLATESAGAESATLEQQVKAAFLCEFAAHVEWPPEAFPGAAAPLTIGVMGDDDLHRTLGEILKGRKAGGRSLQARRIRSIAEIRGCQILFAGRSQDARLPEILGAVRGSPVLTVGETDGFTLRGGVIRFARIDNRIGFEINQDAADRSRLVISKKLLGLGSGVPRRAKAAE
jgi:hypothetical protein